MTALSALAPKFAAAISALAISLVMIGTTVTVPSNAQAHTAYVGTVA